MAWTAPRTWVVGELVSAAQMNAHVRDNFLASNPDSATTFPGSPTTGTRALLVDSTTNPTYQWMFRYNASSTSTYKWEFIGGAPRIVSGTSTTLPAHAGDYVIAAKGWHNEGGGTTTGGDETATLTVGATTIDTQIQNGPSTAASGGGVRGTPSFALLGKVTGAASGATVAVTQIDSDAKISIQPVRVS